MHKLIEPIYASLCVIFILFEIWTNTVGALDVWIHRMVFLGFVLILAFLHEAKKYEVKKHTRNTNLILAMASATAMFYLLSLGQRFVERWALVDPLSAVELLIGTVFIVFSVVITQRTYGKSLTILVLLAIGYSFMGPIFAGTLLGHPGMSFKSFMDRMFYTPDGLLGVSIGVAATYVFAFVTFGSILEQSGGGQFFIKLAQALTGRARGGSAKIAVLASAFYGTISGSAVSDVVTTGVFTIPMMKKQGFSPTMAAAVESVASTGGGIMPPVMGSVAFLMAEFTGIPYVKIATVSIIPALMYYIGVYLQVHFHSLKLGLSQKTAEDDEIESISKVIKDNYYFFIPLGILIWLLIKGYTPSLSALVASVVSIAVTWLKKETRMGAGKILKAIQAATVRIIAVSTACAAAGLVIGGITFTGLGGKFLGLIMHFSGGNYLLSLVLAAGVTIILGMGVPVVPAYALTSALVAPALMELGAPLLVAHLFVLFYCTMSAITPPVAVAAFAASGIAEADPTKTGFQAMRLGIVAFLVPFVFALQPAILLQGELKEVVLTTASTLLGVYGLAAGFEGWMLRTITWYKRVLLLVGSILLIYPGIFTDAVGVLILGCVLMFQVAGKKAGKATYIFEK